MHQQTNQYYHNLHQLQQQQQQLQYQLTQHHHHHQENLTQQPQQQQQHHHPQPNHNLTSSPFKGSILAPVGDEVARVIKDEIINNQSQHQQHQNRDQQNPHSSSSLQHHQQPSQSTTHSHQSQQQQPIQQDLPVLTIRQTQIICEKLINEREKKLREEYDRILMSKLAEQYETFVRYAHDHLEKHNSQHQASYLS